MEYKKNTYKSNGFLNYRLKQHKYGNLINFEFKFEANLSFKL